MAVRERSILVAEVIEGTNPFAALTEVLWARGENGEVLARLLANALAAIIHEGMGNVVDRVDASVMHSEFERLVDPKYLRH